MLQFHTKMDNLWFEVVKISKWLGTFWREGAVPFASNPEKSPLCQALISGVGHQDLLSDIEDSEKIIPNQINSSGDLR